MLLFGSALVYGETGHLDFAGIAAANKPHDALLLFGLAMLISGLAFKASAGLHHAVRTGEAHGFLNLLLAVFHPGAAEEALADPDPARGLTPADGCVRERFRGFGSCSFFEPVDELRALGLL